jgi:hypothetical protein
MGHHLYRHGAGRPEFKDVRLGVQRVLVKLLEGMVATVPPMGGLMRLRSPHPPSPRHDQRPVYLRRAFVAIEDIIAKRLGQGGHGFDQLSEYCQVSADGSMRQAKPEDLEAFGLIPEIIGQLPVITPLEVLALRISSGFFRLRRIRCSASSESSSGSTVRTWCSRMRRSGRSPRSPWSVEREPEG